MIGKRLPDRNYGEVHPKLNPGEYVRYFYDGVFQYWLVMSPTGISCTLNKNHTIVDNPDGTITVSPSIGMHPMVEGKWKWHGFLENGIWREC